MSEEWDRVALCYRKIINSGLIDRDNEAEFPEMFYSSYSTPIYLNEYLNNDTPYFLPPSLSLSLNPRPSSYSVTALTSNCSKALTVETPSINVQ